MGPLAGTKVIEVAGIGPGPFCGMMLADMGADVVRVERLDRASAARGQRQRNFDVLGRGRRSVSVDLKQPEGVELVLRLAEQADVLFEGFRPGVMERLGLGPDVCLGRNPKLIYGRMTGWGQEGPLAHAAGHDINYIGVAGTLHAIGEHGGPPVPPLNLLGDFGGGGLLLAYGIACALVERVISGKGQVVDAAMVDGAALLMAPFHGALAAGGFVEERGSNLLDGGAPFYSVYETADGKHVAIGSIEPQFFAELLNRTGLAAETLAQHDREGWPAMRETLTQVFKQKTRAEWGTIMEGTDVCFAPVLPMSEAHTHPHNVARNTFVTIDGVTQPAPGPRFSRTPGQAGGSAAAREDPIDTLRSFGISDTEIEQLRSGGAIA